MFSSLKRVFNNYNYSLEKVQEYENDTKRGQCKRRFLLRSSELCTTYLVVNLVCNYRTKQKILFPLDRWSIFLYWKFHLNKQAVPFPSKKCSTMSHPFKQFLVNHLYLCMQKWINQRYSVFMTMLSRLNYKKWSVCRHSLLKPHCRLIARSTAIVIFVYPQHNSSVSIYLSKIMKFLSLFISPIPDLQPAFPLHVGYFPTSEWHHE